MPLSEFNALLERVALIGTWIGVDTLSITANVISAVACLFIMQAVTRNAGFSNPLALARLAQRVTLALMALVLVINAASTIATDIDPRPVDVLTQLVLCVTLFLSASHHMGTPKRTTRDGGLE